MAAPLAADRDPEKVCTVADCSAFRIAGGTVCISHGGRLPAVRVAAATVLAETKDRMLRDLAPQALLRVEQILFDEKTCAADVLRASTIVFDRVGMVPGSTVDLRQEVVMPPKEKLAEMLAGVRERLEAAYGRIPPALEDPEIVEAEVVEAEILEFRPDFI